MNLYFIMNNIFSPRYVVSVCITLAFNPVSTLYVHSEVFIDFWCN